MIKYLLKNKEMKNEDLILCKNPVLRSFGCDVPILLLFLPLFIIYYYILGCKLFIIIIIINYY